MPVAEPDIKYCYRCGRRIDPKRPQCWYCGAEKNRELRPDKRCPFCGEAIRFDAIKCKHCGEFVDGREQAQPPPVQQQIIYVVDKEVLRAARDRGLMPGQPVPREVAEHLDPKTIHAIESNQPHLIEAPGVRALPAPQANSQIIDIEPIDPNTSRALSTRRELARPVPAEAAAGEVRSGVPLRPTAPQRELIHRAGFWARFSDWFFSRTPAREQPDESIEVRPSTRYRKCESCGTEILATDNYCFHCGMQYHLTRTDERKLHSVRPGSPALSILIIIACLVLMLGHDQFHLSHNINDAAAGVALLWGIGALLIQRGPIAKLAALFVIPAALLLFIVSL